GALQRVAHGAPNEQEINDGWDAAVLLDGVLQLEAHGAGAGAGPEADRLAAVDLLVLDLHGLPDARLEAHDAFEDPSAAAGLGVPDDHGPGPARPAFLDPEHVPQAVHEGRPAARVVPQLLGVACGDTGELQLGLDAPHRRERYLRGHGLGL